MATLKDHERVSCSPAQRDTGDPRSVDVCARARAGTLRSVLFRVHLMTYRSNDVDLAQSAASPRLSASGCSEGPEVAVFGGIRLCDVVCAVPGRCKKEKKNR